MTRGEQLRAPRSVNLCILENAGLAVLLMGHIQDAPPLPFSLKSVFYMSPAVLQKTRLEGRVVDAANRKKHDAQWMIANRVSQQFT